MSDISGRNAIPNRAVICNVLMETAEKDRDIIVLCSDSRGSSSLTPFADRFPDQFVETGIAEQNLVSIAAGLAHTGFRCWAASPACFISARSYEQAKVDVAYSHTNVKLLGVSGGISYGALGMTHHSAQDIAAMSAIPGMRVYLPSDRVLTEQLTRALIEDDSPAYIRVSRNPSADVYTPDRFKKEPFVMDRAVKVCDGTDVAIIACGEMVAPAAEAALMLREKGVSALVLDMYCVKPVDRQAVIEAARTTKAIITAEEHSPYGGLGSIVSRIVAESCSNKVISLALPDEPVICGSPREVLDYYGLNAAGIYSAAVKALE